MKLLIVLATLCGLSFALYRVDPLVYTNVGLIRGQMTDSGYSKFLGVPYGVIDENNVFGSPLPHPKFDNIFEANDNSKTCLQVFGGNLSGTTDCLNLNIFVPNMATSTNRLPVMVWIHGGAFIGGSANGESSNPLSLLRHDVIVVSINYRLGVFGFMCLDIPEVPGNTGLKDQTLALRWIKENIESFGGDPNQITIFGESAGGMSTNLHLFSSTERLFQRAIIQSGPATSYWMMVESDNTIPLRIAEKLGFTTSDIYEALSFLSAANANLVAQAAAELKITSASGNDQPLTKPCVEKEFEGVEHFLTEHPMNMRSSRASTTPVIIGYNNIEFGFQYASVGSEFFDSYNFSQHFAMGFDMSHDLDDALEAVNHFYLGDEGISEKVRWEIIDFGSDFIFNHPTQRMAEKLLESGARTVYRYVFSYNGVTEKLWSGASHGEELGYLFDMGEGSKATEDQLVIDRLTTLWTNFAKYGNPTPSTSELIPVNWTPITATSHPYLQIDSDLELKNRPFHDRMAFWDLFYKQYGKYQKWYKSDEE